MSDYKNEKMGALDIIALLLTLAIMTIAITGWLLGY